MNSIIIFDKLITSMESPFFLPDTDKQNFMLICSIILPSIIKLFHVVTEKQARNEFKRLIRGNNNKMKKIRFVPIACNILC